MTASSASSGDVFDGFDVDEFLCQFHDDDVGTLAAVIEELFSSLLVCVKGPAGTAVVEDTSGLHRAGPVSSRRLVFWARYGMYRNVAHVLADIGTGRWADLGGRISRDDYYSFVNRLILVDD
jgi:hypothetical protein